MCVCVVVCAHVHVREREGESVWGGGGKEGWVVQKRI